MDHNIVVLAGHLAGPPELRELEGGGRLVRYLVTTRIESPQKRIDVVPVILWDPPESLLAEDPPPGHPIWVAATVQRRFWEAKGGRRSRVEIVASHVCLRDPPDVEPFVGPAGDPGP